MKRIFWCAGILLLINATTVAQTKSSKSKTKQAVQSKTASKNKAGNKSISKSGTIETFNTTAGYPAKANTSILFSPQTRYTITDPILTTLNKRANGADISFNKSGIIGMPKRAYGFADGKIILATTGAVTFGTQTGSGAVGTGTSLATFGSIGAPMNVNGKSPYAGINMWGNAMNMTIIRRDSSVRLAPLKKQ
ncbi:MAG: hypothetical protein J7502_04030 [Flavisolibacter sp.]|nr:hypothetical protein [Flavisolibacter sp.]